jgi:hypothetical protein
VLLNAGVSNLATLSFTAPSMGVVSVTATGTCAVESAFPLTTGVSVSIQTQPLGTMSLAGDSLFSVPVAQVGGSYGFTTTRLVNVASGRQDIFLVLNNAAGAGQLRCSAAMTALFTAQSLP